MSEPIPTFTELDWMGMMLYQLNSREMGRATGVRWWCAREDLRQHWRGVALAEFANWRATEQGFWDERDRI